MRVVASVKWSDKRWSNETWITVKILPASSMFCVRNLSWYIGFGADLGSEALVAKVLDHKRYIFYSLENNPKKEELLNIGCEKDSYDDT
ncbi:hypothetical protein YC2023_041250 [Brassica napus]